MRQAGQDEGFSWLQDWTTIVRSELAAWACDPEAIELLAAMRGLAARAAPGGQDGQSTGTGAGTDGGHAPGTGTQTGAAPVDDASGAGGDRVRRLEARVAELERRLDELARRPRNTRRPSGPV